jgi:hypothetical protein
MIKVKISIKRLSDIYVDEEKYINFYTEMPCIPSYGDLIHVTHPKDIKDKSLNPEKILAEVKFTWHKFNYDNTFSHVIIEAEQG